MFVMILLLLSSSGITKGACSCEDDIAKIQNNLRHLVEELVEYKVSGTHKTKR